MEKPSSESTGSRRHFLQGAGVLTGALLLNRVAEAAATEAAPAKELVLRLKDKTDLAKSGGWEIVEVDGESVIVANTGEGYVACSAICPHKGCEVEYLPEEKQFDCPCHHSRFDLTGKRLKGPAKTDLAPYSVETALVIAAQK